MAEPMGAWNWVFFEDEELDVAGGGMGSVEEMQAYFESHPRAVLFGLLRLGFGEERLRRTKYVFVHAIGEEVPAVTRGRKSAKRPKMEELLKAQCAVSVTGRSISVLSLAFSMVFALPMAGIGARCCVSGEHGAAEQLGLEPADRSGTSP